MATLYWYGGTGNWSSGTAHWSTNSGNSPSATHASPTSSDDVIFDSLSNSTDYTVTVDATASCRDFTLGAPASGKVTFAGSSSLSIYGNENLSGGTAGITYTYSIATTYASTSTGKTITHNGITKPSGMTFNGVGGGWTLQDTINIGSSFILTNGSLNTNGKTITCGSFNTNNSNTRTLDISNSSISCTSFSIATTTGLTFTSTSSTITATGSFSGGGLTYATVNLNNSGAISIGQDNTFGTLTITGGTVVTNTCTLSGNQTVTGTFTCNGNSDNRYRYLIASSSAGTQRTITAGTVSCSYVHFQDIIGAGTGSWDFSASTTIGDCGNNTNMTFITGIPIYWKHGGTASDNWSSANWYTTSGGSTPARFPLPQDTVYFDSGSFAATGKTVNVDVARIPKTVWTGATNSPTFVFTDAVSIFGDLTLISGMTCTGSNKNVTFEKRGATSTITKAGITTRFSVTVKNVDGTLSFSDNFDNSGTGSNTLTLTSGTLDLNGKTVTTNTFSTSGTLTKTLNFNSGTLSVSAQFNCGASTNFTVSGSGTIKLTDNNQTFYGGGKTYPNIWYSAGTGKILTIADTCACSDLKCDGSQTIKFTNSTTFTLTTFTTPNTAGNVVTLRNSSLTTQATIAKAGGGTISCDYMDVDYLVGSPASTWYMGTHSTDGGHNTTIYFTAPPAPGASNGNFFAFM